MDFLDLVSIKQHLSTLISDVAPTFQRIIIIEEIELRIHASKFNYCDPENNFDRLSYYKSVEINLVEATNGKMNTISPYTDVRFKNFEWSKYFQYDKKGVLVPSYRGHYVLVEDLPQIIRDIYKVQQFKSFY